MRLTYALIFQRRGVNILPCYAKRKAIVKGFGPYKKHLEDDLSLYRWIQEKGFNYALVTGGDLVVLDFDSEEVYQEWLDLVGEELADTFKVRTARGYHVYYRTKDARSWRADGVDVLGANKVVMGPYSVHPEGVIYRPLNQPHIRQVDTVADFPLLSDSRPVVTPPPDKAPAALQGGQRGQDTISRIKATWPVLKALAALQPETLQSLKGAGRWRRGLCPFHDDHKRSFWVDTERGLFGCHACDAHGDVINLVAMSRGITVGDAISAMKREAWAAELIAVGGDR
jgi:hypothetical protein